MIDAGLGFPTTKYIQTYAIAAFKHPKTSVSAAYYTVAPKDTRYYGYAAYHDNNIYGVVGNNVKTTFAAAGTYDLKYFGSYTFITHNRENGNIWMKSQTAFGNVNNNVFCVKSLDKLSDIFTIPLFQPVHLDPVSTKGDYAIKLEYKKTPSSDGEKKNCTSETELMIATSKTPVQIGLGVNTSYKNNSSISNVAIELYKDFKLGKKFTGSIEGRYNNRTKETTGYLKMKYNI